MNDVCITVTDDQHSSIHKYSTREVINRISCKVFHAPFGEQEYQRIGDLSPLCQDLIAELLEIEGIEQIWPSTNSVEIKICDAYSWGEIEPLILHAIKCTVLRAIPTKNVKVMRKKGIFGVSFMGKTPLSKLVKN